MHERRVPVPSPGRGQVLIRLETAGVGSWDPFEREGGYAEMLVAAAVSASVAARCSAIARLRMLVMTGVA